MFQDLSSMSSYSKTKSSILEFMLTRWPPCLTRQHRHDQGRREQEGQRLYAQP